MQWTFQFAGKCIPVNFKNISVYVFDMLSMENGIMTLDEDVSCHFYCEKVECSDRKIRNPDKRRCECRKCNDKLDEDTY